MKELDSLEPPIALYCNDHQAVRFVTKGDNGEQFSRLPALRMRLFDHHPPSQASRWSLLMVFRQKSMKFTYPSRCVFLRNTGTLVCEFESSLKNETPDISNHTSINGLEFGAHLGPFRIVSGG